MHSQSALFREAGRSIPLTKQFFSKRFIKPIIYKYASLLCRSHATQIYKYVFY